MTELPVATEKVRQAVVIVHGMGEQRPLDTLNGFIHAAIPTGTGGAPRYYSRPDKVTESYEARRYLVPHFPLHGQEVPQTEVYEYHWAHLMQGNRLDDMATTVRRMLLQPPGRVPSGLRVVWFLFWAAIILAVWAFWLGPFSDLELSGGLPETVTRTIFGGGITALLLTYLVARLLPSWITTSFVDVVRYVDTSPRSYEARRLIRKGIVDLLEGLHESRRYQRIVLVAHSLGAYIAYDGLTYLWARMNKLHDGLGAQGGEETPLSGLKELEKAASDLGSNPTESQLTEFRDAQRTLWLGLRQQGNPWLVTDFVTVGTPMYFADQLYTKNRRRFDARVERRELPTCPPQPEEAEYNNINGTHLWYSWNNRGRRVLYHGAPFAVVRWTNLWFRPRLGLFGDWFGGPLAPLFGGGIRDVELQGNKPWRWTPGYTHTLYFRFPKDVTESSATSQLRRAIDLPSADWLKETLQAPDPSSRTA
jgi:hypothetical protein